MNDSAGVLSGLMLFSLLNVLNISRIGIELVPSAEPERPLDAPVEGEELVVLPFAVAAAVFAVEHTRVDGDRLRAAGLHPRVELDAVAHTEVAERVELVADVPIGRPPVAVEIKEVEAAIGERVALVRVVVLVLGEHVVGFQLVPVGVTLADAEGQSTIA